MHVKSKLNISYVIGLSILLSIAVIIEAMYIFIVIVSPLNKEYFFILYIVLITAYFIFEIIIKLRKVEFTVLGIQIKYYLIPTKKIVIWEKFSGYMNFTTKDGRYGSEIKRTVLYLKDGSTIEFNDNQFENIKIIRNAIQEKLKKCPDKRYKYPLKKWAVISILFIICFVVLMSYDKIFK